jgi:hypothetical protein
MRQVRRLRSTLDYGAAIGAEPDRVAEPGNTHRFEKVAKGMKLDAIARPAVARH